jgi:hypothetical protein
MVEEAVAVTVILTNDLVGVKDVQLIFTYELEVGTPE